MISFKLVFLILLMRLHNVIYHRINKIAININNGIHPKHRIMNYQKFFVDNVELGSKILDIGCGIGFLTYKLSEKAEKVIGCDYNSNSLNYAKFFFNRENIDYLLVDATNYEFKEKFDYIILSNVLEHIQDRIFFLNKLKFLTNYFLIRVPMINRSWLVLYKKELGIDYRLDPSHYIEYTYNNLRREIEDAGLKIISLFIQFGEIWAKIQSKYGIF